MLVVRDMSSEKKCVPSTKDSENESSDGVTMDSHCASSLSGVPSLVSFTSTSSLQLERSTISTAGSYVFAQGPPSMDPVDMNWKPIVVNPLDWRSVWALQLGGKRKLTINYAYEADKPDVATNPKLHIRNWYTSSEEPGVEIASRWGATLSGTDLENLLQMLKQASQRGFREMVMERLQITITSKGVKLKKLESNSHEVCVPHDEMRFLMKLFPFFIELFQAIRSQDRVAKMRLLDLLMITFAISKMYLDSLDPKSLFQQGEIDGSPGASLEQY